MSDGTLVHSIDPHAPITFEEEPAPRPGVLRTMAAQLVVALVGDYVARMLIAAARERGGRVARDYSADDVLVTNTMARRAFAVPSHPLRTRTLRRIHRDHCIEAPYGRPAMSLRSFAEALAAGDVNVDVGHHDRAFAQLAARHFMRAKCPGVSSTLIPDRFSPDTAEVLL